MRDETLILLGLAFFAIVAFMVYSKQQAAPVMMMQPVGMLPMAVERDQRGRIISFREPGVSDGNRPAETATGYQWSPA